MGGVPKVTTEERFRRHFERFGTIDRVELNAERSFGFVTYAHAAMVDAVLATRMHQFEHAEHQTSFVEVRRPKPRGNRFSLCPHRSSSGRRRRGTGRLRRLGPRRGRPGRLHFGEVPARHQRRAQRASPALHARPYFKDAQLRRVPQYKVAVAVQTWKRARDDALVALAVRVAPQREAQAAS